MSNSSNSSASSGGIGFTGLLTVLFIGLKLTGYIAWDWIWVLSPLWLGVALVIAIICLMLITAAIGAAFKAAFVDRSKRPKGW